MQAGYRPGVSRSAEGGERPLSRRGSRWATAGPVILMERLGPGRGRGTQRDTGAASPGETERGAARLGSARSGSEQRQVAGSRLPRPSPPPGPARPIVASQRPGRARAHPAVPACRWPPAAPMSGSNGTDNRAPPPPSPGDESITARRPPVLPVAAPRGKGRQSSQPSFRQKCVTPRPAAASNNCQNN